MFADYFNKMPMPVFDKKIPMLAFLETARLSKSSIGFVPTMGAIHEGHLSLMLQSLANNDCTIVSIFVNPTQFTSVEDLVNYPRTLQDDVEKISNLSRDIVIYAPAANDVYENELISEAFDFDGLENQLEGKFRPGHFDGVGTVVKRLFEIVVPTNAYFGEKDFQQLQIVRKMVLKNEIKVNIIGCPILREQNQLAMSSRNELLDEKYRKKASIIYQTLTKSKEKFTRNSAKQVSNWVKKVFSLNTTFTLEYYEIVNEDDLLPVVRKRMHAKYRALIAVRVNNIRLIDNIALN